MEYCDVTLQLSLYFYHCGILPQQIRSIARIDTNGTIAVINTKVLLDRTSVAALGELLGAKLGTKLDASVGIGDTKRLPFSLDGDEDGSLVNVSLGNEDVFSEGDTETIVDGSLVDIELGLKEEIDLSFFLSDGIVDGTSDGAKLGFKLVDGFADTPLDGAVLEVGLKVLLGELLLCFDGILLNVLIVGRSDGLVEGHTETLFEDGSLVRIEFGAQDGAELGIILADDGSIEGTFEGTELGSTDGFIEAKVLLGATVTPTDTAILTDEISKGRRRGIFIAFLCLDLPH